MSFLLDTNAISEPQRSSPDRGYMAWLAGQQAAYLFVSVLSLGEIRLGVIALPQGPHRSALEAWLATASDFFAERSIAVDQRVARCWADVALTHRRTKQVVSLADELIAATALAHGLTVVTRNLRDFRASGCQLLSPWSA